MKEMTLIKPDKSRVPGVFLPDYPRKGDLVLLEHTHWYVRYVLWSPGSPAVFVLIEPN